MKSTDWFSDDERELSLSDARLLDRLCQEFEAAWRSGASPSIEGCLSACPKHLRKRALFELLCIEIEWRRRRGTPRQFDFYVQRFPDDRDAVVRAVESGHQATTGYDTDRDWPTRDLHAPGEASSEAASGESGTAILSGRYVLRHCLGEGGFGRVHLARDTRLERLVAVKVPNLRLLDGRDAVKKFVTEARTAAGLKHPGIVAVYDIEVENGCPYVVQEYIEGTTLAQRMAERGRVPPSDAVELTAEITRALGYAHQHGIIHRDLKPANVLLDTAGTPHVADFGLAVKASLRLQRKGEIAGTPAYMSPEQVRGETHRLDGRTDVWSLGVILYQLLTGTRPFAGDTPDEVFANILEVEPLPPRQLNPDISPELERICLRCLEKEPGLRYGTAEDLVEELVSSSMHEEPVPAGKPAQDSLIPKGLRAFDEHDASFFLSLLPGPKDRQGLPESIRFWKNRIEGTQPDSQFAVGLLYGPSGSGKSSLVRAGLLPRLSQHIRVIYVQVTGLDLRPGLESALRREFPDIPRELSLRESLRWLRETGLSGQKLLLVLDQFEHWLHADGIEGDREFVESLRQCHGESIQCLLLTRDDYFAAAHRLFRRLDEPLVERRNYALVDRFDRTHARFVLEQFGRAYARLGTSREENDETTAFLDQAVEELAEDGRVVPVRLALFAEMMKHREWVPRSLRDVGGLRGLGVLFLEETFSEHRGPTLHGRYREAAVDVFRYLLPETSSSLKGRVRSEDELFIVTRLTESDFEEFLRILDTELRIITPVDTGPRGEHVEDASPEAVASGAPRFYQLTHDYLVRAIRDWLDAEKRSTRRGRAEIHLRERTFDWLRSGSNRSRLPTLLEYASYEAWTSGRSRTDAQRSMMRRARRHHGIRLALFVVIVGLIGLVVVVDQRRRVRVDSLVDTLLLAESGRIPEVLEELRVRRNLALPRLRARYAQTTPLSEARLRAALGLAALEGRALSDLPEYLLRRADPGEAALIIGQLRDKTGALDESALWRELSATEFSEVRTLRAAAALASLRSDDRRWDEPAHGDVIVRALLDLPAREREAWMELLAPIRLDVAAAAARYHAVESHPPNASRDALLITLEFGLDSPETLAQLLRETDGDEFRLLLDAFRNLGEVGIAKLESILSLEPGSDPQFGDRADSDALERQHLRDRFARWQAAAAIALVRLGHPESAWPLFRHPADSADLRQEDRDPRLRTFLIHRWRPFGARPDTLLERFRVEDRLSAQRALLLALGEFDEGDFGDGSSVPPDFLDELRLLYRTHPDAGMHAAAGWVLTQWGENPFDAETQGDLHETAGRLPLSDEDPRRNWYVTSEGHHMVVVPPGSFRMGSTPESDPARGPREISRSMTIDRAFALAATSVTFEQFERFQQATRLLSEESFDAVRQRASTDDSPVVAVDWYMAAAYCNWLSEREGIPQDQWCYEPNEEGNFGEGMRIRVDHRLLAGFRLPHSAEWEYACRAGATTQRHFGYADELLHYYGYFIDNSGGQLRPVAGLKPNDWGLFDVHGNALNWGNESVEDYLSTDPLGSASTSVINDVTSRGVFGGSFGSFPPLIRCAWRDFARPSSRGTALGFRPARTVTEWVADQL